MGKEVLGYLQTHWDREWYKTFEEFRIRLCDVLEKVFAKLDNNEINSFYFDGQVVALLDYLEIHPEKYDYIKTLIKNRKLFIGPFYDLADEFLVNGESLARNLLIGINIAKQYGVDKNDFVGYLPDAFGHCAWMPMLFKKSNINNAIVWRGIKSNSQEFQWIAPDNSMINTTYLKAGYFQDFLHKKSYKKNLKKLLSDLLFYTNKNTPVLLPIGGDHLACIDNIKAKIKNFNRENKDFHIKLSSLYEYFNQINGNNPPLIINGELRNNENSYILMGTTSSRIDLKKLNILSEWELGKVIEPICTVFKIKKENLNYAWKTLLKNHAHDSICGCSLDEVHQENILRYNKVLQITNSLKNEIITKLSNRIQKNKIGIINTSNFDYTGIVSFYSDKKLPLVRTGNKKAFPIEISQNLYQAPIQEDYRTYYEYLYYAKKIRGCSFEIADIKTPISSALNIKSNSISNEFLSISVNSDGTINIKNKISKIEFKNIFKIIDKADVGDSYNFSCILNDKPIEATFKGTKIIEDNYLRNILRLFYEIKIPSHATNNQKRSKKFFKHLISVDLVLQAFSKRLDIKIQYKNQSKDHIMKLNFALPKTITQVESEDTFGTIKRFFEPNYNYKDLLPLDRYKEIDINTRPFQRFVMTQGLCIITKGLQEYEVYKNNLNITLLRSFGVISKKSLLTRTAAAGPPLPTPKGQMLGNQSAEISLLLTDNSTEAFHETDFFYNPFVIIDGKSDKTKIKPYQYLNLPENLYLYSFKQAEDSNGMIAKIFNYTNEIQKLTIHKKSIETNLLEENLSEENLIGQDILFAPNELKIFRIS